MDLGRRLTIVLFLKLCYNIYTESKERKLLSMEKSNKYYTVYSARIAAKLRENGFDLVRMAKNTKFPKFNVFYFKNTPALRRAVEFEMGRKEN